MSIFQVEYNKFNFRWGAALTQLGELTALPRSIAGGEGADCPQEPIPVSTLSWDGGVADP